MKRVNGELLKNGAPHKNMRMFDVAMTPPDLLSPQNKLEIRDRKTLPCLALPWRSGVVGSSSGV